jgi:hypothetical protein
MSRRSTRQQPVKQRAVENTAPAVPKEVTPAAIPTQVDHQDHVQKKRSVWTKLTCGICH